MNHQHYSDYVEYNYNINSTKRNLPKQYSPVYNQFNKGKNAQVGQLCSNYFLDKSQELSLSEEPFLRQPSSTQQKSYSIAAPPYVGQHPSYGSGEDRSYYEMHFGAHTDAYNYQYARQATPTNRIYDYHGDMPINKAPVSSWNYNYPGRYATQAPLNSRVHLASGNFNYIAPYPSATQNAVYAYDDHYAKKEVAPSGIAVLTDDLVDRRISQSVRRQDFGTEYHQFTVVLKRERQDRSGVGIILQGGTDYGMQDITVQKVIPDSIAYRDGRIRYGDTIISINGYNVRGISHRVALEYMKARSPEVVFVVGRNNHQNETVLKQDRRIQDSGQHNGSNLNSEIKHKYDFSLAIPSLIEALTISELKKHVVDNLKGTTVGSIMHILSTSKLVNFRRYGAFILEVIFSQIDSGAYIEERGWIRLPDQAARYAEARLKRKNVGSNQGNEEGRKKKRVHAYIW